jgi:peptide/nickel transport system ATP-binding protein
MQQEDHTSNTSRQITAPLLQLRDLRIHFRSRVGLFRSKIYRAVDGVNLSLHRGEVVALVGESGSGKTSVGRASLGLIAPVSGSVIFDGIDITLLPEKRLQWFRKRAQAIFQDPFSSINPYMNVGQLVEEPLVIHRIGSRSERQDRVTHFLEDVKLTPTADFLKRYPHELSGGQRQRVGIARALVMEPDYIVADEPISMIDASSRSEFLYLLRSLRDERGICFLYITHDIASARHFADKIAVMYLGSIVEIATPEKLINQPEHPYTQSLINAVPEPDPNNRFHYRAVIAGEAPTSSQIPQGCPFHPRCSAFMEGICEVDKPYLYSIQENHEVACYLPMRS